MTRTDHPRYTLTELAGLAGVTPRTVRYYTAQGLLPAVATSGPGAKYGDAQLARLRLIRRLQRDHLPLAAIRQRLERLDDTTVLALAESPPAPADSALDYIRAVMRGPVTPPAPIAAPAAAAPALPAPPPSAVSTSTVAASALSPAPPPSPARPLAAGPQPEPQLQRAQWERITLAQDIELHVRRPLPRTLAKQVDRLVSIARDLLEEDPT